MALFPKHGALYFALMSLTDQLFLWTYGVWITKPRSNRQTFADEHPATSLGAKLLGMLSPALVAVILAIAIVLAGVPVPQTVIAPLHLCAADDRLGRGCPEHGEYDDDHRGTADHERHRHVLGT